MTPLPFDLDAASTRPPQGSCASVWARSSEAGANVCVSVRQDLDVTGVGSKRVNRSMETGPSHGETGTSHGETGALYGKHCGSPLFRHRDLLNAVKHSVGKASTHA